MLSSLLLSFFLLLSPLSLLALEGQHAAWKRYETGDQSPGYRWGHNCVSHGNGDLVLFGGWLNEAPGPNNDVFYYQDKNWKQVPPSDPIPHGRWGFNMVPLLDESGFLVFGGLNDSFPNPDHISYNDIWKYSYNSGDWKMLRKNDSPDLGPPNNTWYELSAVPYEDGLAFIEGVQGTVWYFSQDTMKWSILFEGKDNSLKPGGTVCLDDQCQQIVSFDGFMNVWEFNTQSKEWSLMVSNTTTPVPNTARYQYLLGTQSSEHILLFGGSFSPDEGDQLNDLWNLLKNNDGSWHWEEAQQINAPSPREHSCWPLQPIRERLMYGGYGEGPHSMGGDFDDTWGLFI